MTGVELIEASLQRSLGGTTCDRPPWNTGETFDLTGLNRLWEVLQGLWAECARVDATFDRGLTERKFDHAQAAGDRLWINASGQMAVTRDNLSALWALFEHHGAHVWATWSLLRPAFETSFNGCWLLEPDAGLERRRRGLRLEVRNFIEGTNVLDEYKASPTMRKKVEQGLARREARSGQVYRKEAADLGTTWHATKQSINVRDELLKLDFVRALEPDLRAFIPATWRTLSGAEHGFAHALLSTSTTQRSLPIEGGQAIQVVIDDDRLGQHARTVIWLAAQAARLYIRRSTRTS